MGANGCSCKRWLDPYVWEPSRCSLATWDAAAFCEALGGRSLTLLGDSTMRQTAVAVINAVHWGTWGGAGCQEQISFGISDTLIGRGLGVMNRGGSWTEWVNRTRARASGPEAGASPGPHIVVLSAGASRTSFMQKAYASVVVILVQNL